MTQTDFLETLHQRLAGMPQDDIDDIMADYAAHFAEGLAAGRSEEDIATALGDPLRLARELRAEAGFRRWETKRTPGNFFAAMFGFLALVAVDFVLLLPALGGLLLFTFIAGVLVVSLCIAGLGVMASLLRWGNGFVAVDVFARILSGVGLLGFGVGGGALLLLLIDGVVRLLGRYARLHYTLLNQADTRA